MSDENKESLLSKYSDLLEGYSKKNVRTANGLGSARTEEVIALAESLENFTQLNEAGAAGSLSSLGLKPRAFLSVISAAAARSILPIVASVQAMDSEHGIVYRPKLDVSVTANGFTAGDNVLSTTSPQLFDSAFGGSRKLGKSGDTLAPLAPWTDIADPSEATPAALPFDGTAVDFGLDFGNAVYTESIALLIVDTANNNSVVGRLIDTGTGQLFGDTAGGTVNYAEGHANITFNDGASADAAYAIIGRYDIDSERSELPRVALGYESELVKSEVFAVQGDQGLVEAFSMKKRFGSDAEAILARQMASALTNTMNAAAIERMVNATVTPGAVPTYTIAPPAGVSVAEHKLAFIDTTAAAEEVLVGQAGKGFVSCYVAGRTAARVMRSLPGFVVNTEGNNQNVSLYGSLDGIPVIRANGLVADAEAIACYRGSEAYDAPMVHSVFMPLIATPSIRDAANPLQTSQAIATMSAVQITTPSFLTKIQFS